MESTKGKARFTKSFIIFRENITRLMFFYKFSKRDYEITSKRLRNLISKLEGKKVEAEEVPVGEVMTIEFTKKELDLVKRAMKKTKKDYELILPFIRSQILIFGVTSFECYIKDVVKFIYSKNINILKIKSKSVAYDKLLSFKDLDDIHGYLIEKECHSLGYMSYDELADYFLKKLQVDFSGSGVNKEGIIEILSMRNVLIHNRGVVNRAFLESTRTRKYKLGDEIKIDEKIVENSLGLLMKQAKYIDSRVSKKY